MKLMKKIPPFVFALVLFVLVGGAVKAKAEIIDSGFCGYPNEQDIKWELDDTGVMTFSGTGEMGYPGGVDAYRCNTNSNGNTYKLSSIVIGDGITSVYYGYDENSNSYHGSFNALGNGARKFLGVTSVYIGKDVETIGQIAFNGCPNLSSLTFAEGSKLKSIGLEAFAGTKLNGNLTIPASVETIEKGAFQNTNISSVTFAAGSNLKTIGGFNGTKLTSISIPSSVTAIGENAFKGCTSLNTSIPSGVTSIGNSAFNGCKGLTSIVIPDGVTSIGSSVFQGCTGITSVTIGKNVESIGTRAFDGCTGITSMTIESTKLKTIGSYAFNGCTGNLVFVLPNGVESIGEHAFFGCTGATVVLPKSIQSIGVYAFNGIAYIYCCGSKSDYDTATGGNTTYNNAVFYYNYVPLESISIGDETLDIGLTVTRTGNGGSYFNVDTKEHTFNLVKTPAEGGSSAPVTWTSSNTNVLTVDDNGKITTGGYIGESTITVSIPVPGGVKTASCVVTVRTKAVEVRLNKESITIAAGGWDASTTHLHETERLSATLYSFVGDFDGNEVKDSATNQNVT